MASRCLLSLAVVVSAVSITGCGGADPPPDSAEKDSSDLELRAGDPRAGDLASVATDVYGPLYVQAGNFTGEATPKAWSSWWYPTREDTLFRSKSGVLSPLEKYDRYVREVLRRSSSAAEFERKNLYDPYAAGWSGLCDAWAIASIMEPEPTHDIIRHGIRFTVGDQKALLIKTYEDVQGLRLIGQRNDAQWDSVYADIYPDQFHIVLKAELLDGGRPFIMDHDAGIEVWNTPVWKAIVEVKEDPTDAATVHVRTTVVTASPFVDDRDYTGTLEVTRTYTYDLVGAWEADRRFKVTSGRWTDRSRWDHPDFVIPKPTSLTQKSRNTEINVDVVSAILQR